VQLPFLNVPADFGLKYRDSSDEVQPCRRQMTVFGVTAAAESVRITLHSSVFILQFFILQFSFFQSSISNLHSSIFILHFSLFPIPYPQMPCPLCRSRPAKRQCPAVGQLICPVCCGTKRLVEIRCPSTCSYLTSAKRHPAAVTRRQHERDVSLLMPAMTELTDRQSRFFFLFQSITARHPSDALRPLLDSDVAEAAGAVARTLETASRGVIYESTPQSLPAQELASAFRRAFDEIAAELKGPRSPLERDGARALSSLSEAASKVGPLEGNSRDGFLTLVRRLLKPQSAPSGQPEEPASGPSLLLP
jgi:hypothetical protein